MPLLYQIDPSDNRPAARQLSDKIIRCIHEGLLLPRTRLLGTRKVAKLLGINRKTVIAAYEDVVNQGYLVSQVGSGYKVVENLPPRPRYLTESASPTQLANFSFDHATPRPDSPRSGQLRLTEGAPDVRLAELDKLYVEARRLFNRPTGKQLSRYGDGRGDRKLRELLSSYLGSSRGIPIKADNVLITRGSQHGFQLASRLLFRSGGVLIAAQLSYEPILHVARDFGAEIIRIPLDEQGMVVETLVNHPALDRIKAVYVTPHHQYPTTVTLTPQRRLLLLDLAQKHGFAILEDDYDYDFYYEGVPALPLAALDRHANVIYLGSFTKILAPNLRIGYLTGPTDFIDSALHHRLLTDRQGDLVLERALANFMQAGDLERHLRKVRPIYRQRRDLLVNLLREKFGDTIEFQIPSGGMALWAKFTDVPPFNKLKNETEIWLSPSHKWWTDSNGIRLGFASLNEKEMRRAITLLASALLRD